MNHNYRNTENTNCDKYHSTSKPYCERIEDYQSGAMHTFVPAHTTTNHNVRMAQQRVLLNCTNTSSATSNRLLPFILILYRSFSLLFCRLWLPATQDCSSSQLRCVVGAHTARLGRRGIYAGQCPPRRTDRPGVPGKGWNQYEPITNMNNILAVNNCPG